MVEIHVKITRYKDRPAWLAYYDDPLSGRRITRSTGQRKKADALKFAGKWEDELRQGTYKPSSQVTWEEFRQRYEDEVLPGLAELTDRMLNTVFNAVERICRPKRLRDLDASRLSYFQAQLRIGRSEATVRSYMAHLLAALKWAKQVKMLPAVPEVAKPKRAKTSKVMKGRPITLEEFDRMLAKVEDGLLAAGRMKIKQRKECKRKYSEATLAKIGDDRRQRAAAVAASWRHLLRGLMLSGLRLGEAMELYWDRTDKLSVDFSGRRPMLRILASLEKGNQDRLLPITPDFAEFLLSTPQAERTGPIFRPCGTNGREVRDSVWVGRVIAQIGKAARVKVNDAPLKFASAHDLRRTFGARWATRVMPAVLQQLMRHESIETTMKYYVGINAEANADAIWDAAGRTSPAAKTERVNISVNNCSPSSIGSAKEKSQVLTDSRLSECSLMDSNHQPSD